MIKIFDAQSIEAENLQISELINSSVNCAEGECKQERGFNDEERDAMIYIYFGQNASSKYYKSVKSYLKSANGFISAGSKDDLENVLMSLIITHIGHKIGMANYDTLFGTSSREDLVSIAEDCFIKCLATYNLNRDVKLQTEIYKKLSDPNYQVDVKSFKSFNAYIYKSIGRELLRHTKKPGKYGPKETITEEYTQIDKDGNSRLVTKTTEQKGPYLVDFARAPLELSLSNIDTFAEGTELPPGETSDAYLFDNNPMAYEDEDLNGIFDQAHIDELKKAYDEIFAGLSWEEKTLLRNFDDYCELYGETKLRQREIAELLHIKQGTVSKNIGNLCFKITNEIFKRGFVYNENSFS